ncbi:unnamed protein product [Rhizoctonia solani]|uniref:Uncharacterized protein n=1 Tax=Rhizoctonia solani TaxID=456999 RepID=A0A8H2XPF1_9AGAM|nr:unnamed protein product [Rhizoctonia solani]
MGTIFRSSESLPSLHSFQSLQKPFNESHHSSVHLLAYLAQDSIKSLESINSRERGEVNPDEDGSLGESLACHEAWWNDLIELKPFKLRPLSNFGVELASNVPTNRTEVSHSDAAPIRPRHRPPPLELDPRIISSRKENVDPSLRLPLRPKPSPNKAELDSSSPWHILNEFPTPPTTPIPVRRSKTSTGIREPSHKACKEPPASAPVSKDCFMEYVENKPAYQAFKKKRQSSFGSLGKVLRTTSASIPCTPPPIPTAWLQFDPMCEKESETKSLPGLQRRETFKSRLFSFSASPKASPRGPGTGYRNIPPQHSTHVVSHREYRSVSESARKGLSPRQESKHYGDRSRSASQPTQFKGRKDKSEPDTPASDDVISLSHSDWEKHIIIPKRRTQSQSYISLVPPRKQGGPSPTQVDFPVEGGVPSTPTTPIGGIFDLPNETMYLPASGSAQSLTAELDPFGAGEPDSFFRSDYGTPMDTVEVDQATSLFYHKIGMGPRISRKWRLVQQSVVAHCVPDIVVSTSRGLGELKRRSLVAPN